MGGNGGQKPFKLYTLRFKCTFHFLNYFLSSISFVNCKLQVSKCVSMLLKTNRPEKNLPANMSTNVWMNNFDWLLG